MSALLLVALLACTGGEPVAPAEPADLVITGDVHVGPGQGWERLAVLVDEDLADLGDVFAGADSADFVADMLEVVRAVERRDVMRLVGRGGEPQRRFEPPAVAHHRVVVADR